MKIFHPYISSWVQEVENLIELGTICLALSTMIFKENLDTLKVIHHENHDSVLFRDKGPFILEPPLCLVETHLSNWTTSFLRWNSFSLLSF